MPARAPAISWLLSLVLLVPVPRAAQEPEVRPQDFEGGYESITEKDLKVHATELASPQLEGRDSPSKGLYRAGEYIIGRLKAAGIEPGMGVAASYRQTYSLKRRAPVADRCHLAVIPPDGDEIVLELGKDFVPYPHCPGQGEGALSFFGFGITESGERYDDLRGKNCKDEIVMVLEGEPRNKRLFEGPDEITEASDAYAKIKALEERGARGVLLVRRAPAEQPKGLDDRPLEPTEIGFRHTWAFWNFTRGGKQGSREGHTNIPVAEITEAAASRILGEDVTELAAKMDSSGKPIRKEIKGLKVSLSTDDEEQMVPIDNIVGLVKGTDPALTGEYLVLGAHYDHIGVDSWGRVGCGADDNGSGSSGLLEIAEAMAIAHPRRSILVTWFSAEEDGLLGSEEFAAHPPVAMSSVVTMLNVDMIGRCAEDEVYVVGTHFNPALEDVLKEAKKLKPPKLKKIYTDKALDLWERSDQYHFHKQGVPALFFTEGAIDAENPDYHVYSDTVDKLSFSKMARISRFMFATAWLIANDPERPPRPK